MWGVTEDTREIQRDGLGQRKNVTRVIRGEKIRCCKKKKKATDGRKEAALPKWRERRLTWEEGWRWGKGRVVKRKVSQAAGNYNHLHF